MIETALPSLSAWTNALRDVDIPVLPGSAAELIQLRAIEDANGNVDAHTLNECLGNDPLMTLKVLAHVSRYCVGIKVEPPETLVGAIVMLGITPFFRAFDATHSITHWLHDYPEALSGLIKVITRARRASNFTMDFALRRQDEDAVVMQEAALLHDFAEMLLWCHAPTLALEIAQRQKADHTVRSIDIQMEVLGIQLSDLAHELMLAWQLPNMLIKCTNDRSAHNPQIRTVMLGVQIARHTQYGWEDQHALAALPDDVAEVAQLLNLSDDAAFRLLISMDS
ncbi:MAG: HDOD domain-containing protein [Aquabacterium sp.]|nr:HDOD domain-containing protein [Aquabacterium sp.]